MSHRLRVAWATTALFLLLGTLSFGQARAQDGGPLGPIYPQHSDAAWQAWYWNNQSFAGDPVLQRQESNIDHDWGEGSPDGRIPSDHFSARWTRYLDVQPGRYRFTATSDDGMRVWIDNNRVIDQWYDHPPVTASADVNLGTGHHLVMVEYYENTGEAVARVTWGPATQDIRNWRGEYFNNTSLDGSPALVRDDPQINFNWDYASPAPGVVNADYFSVRWTRRLDLPSGFYHFSLTIDDGGRLWVNNHLLIDSWQVQSARTYVGDIYLSGGQTNIKVEYYENTGRAVAQLNWSNGTGPVPPGPKPGEIVVDDGSAGFVKGGTPSAWSYASGGYGGSYIFTFNNDWARPNYNWARWYAGRAGLGAGNYEAYVYIPQQYATTTAANYWISHAGAFSLRVVNQSIHGGQWVSLGTYWFAGNDTDYVSLSDVTGEPFVTHSLAFDAVKWVAR